MEKNQLIIFKSDLYAQLGLVKIIYQKLVERSNNLEPNDIIRLESIAYQIHNLYNATEDLMKTIATQFENNISDSSQWHSILIQRMSQEIPEVRPAFLSLEASTILNGLRGFRHFFRHAYGTNIEYTQLKTNLDKALNLVPVLEDDLGKFIQKISTKTF
jgi:hypothetical protein